MHSDQVYNTDSNKKQQLSWNVIQLYPLQIIKQTEEWYETQMKCIC